MERSNMHHIRQPYHTLPTKEARSTAAHALAYRMGRVSAKSRFGTPRRIVRARETVQEAASRIWSACRVIRPLDQGKAHHGA